MTRPTTDIPAMQVLGRSMLCLWMLVFLTRADGCVSQHAQRAEAVKRLAAQQRNDNDKENWTQPFRRLILVLILTHLLS